jgi:selenocysteine lyase/cysteine desulfurase
MDVATWGVDWYAFSTYKVYGPHMAALWGTRAAMAELEGPNHFFVAAGDLPYKLELGGVNHEACAGLLGVRDYLAFLAEEAEPDRLDRHGVEQAFDVMAACELPVQARLISYLESRPEVRIIGPAHAEESRVGTVSFVHRSKRSREITDVVDRSGIAIRSGHMYAYRLCEALGLDPADGVVRVSLVHYNTVEEIDQLIGVLESVL